MSEELPEGWIFAPLLDLCELIRGVSYIKGEANPEPAKGLIALLRANNIQDGLQFNDLQYVPAMRVKKAQQLLKWDVIVAMSSGSKAVVGKAAQNLYGWSGTFGAFCSVHRPTVHIHPRFFGIFFETKTYRNGISDASAGTNINNLKREHFGAFSIPLPPLAEQQRIVAKVEALLAQVNAARERLAKVPAILKRFRQAVLAAACSGRLTANWRGQCKLLEPASLLVQTMAKERVERWMVRNPRRKYKEPEPVAMESLPEISDIWTWTNFDHCAYEITVGHVGPMKDRYVESGIPFLRSQNIRPLRFDSALCANDLSIPGS